MTQKYIAFLLLPLMSGCTLLGGPDDFSDMYNAHIQSQMASLHQIGEDLGIGQKYTFDGSMKFSGEVPGIMSGVLSTEYTSKTDGRSFDFSAKNTLLAYEALIASGSVSVGQLDMISHAGDVFFRFADIRQSNMLSPAMLSVFEKYANTWLALKKEDMQNALSGATQEDILSYQISESLSSLTLQEIEEYLTDYPVFRETKDLGMSGSLHGYEIMLDAPSIVSLLDAFSLRITGSGLTLEERDALSSNISSMSSSGVVFFDPKKSDSMDLVLNLSSPDSPSVKLQITQSDERVYLSIGTDMSTLTFSTDKTEKNKRNILMSMTQAGMEAVKIVSNIEYREKKISQIDATFSSPMQGITVTLLHKNMENGGFEGDMNLGFGKMSWTGSYESDRLKGLHVLAAMPGQALTLSLDPKSDDMIQGPLVIRSGESEIFRSNIGLRVVPDRFSFAFDMEVPVDGTGAADIPRMRFDGDIISKRSEFSGKVDAPSDTKSFQEFIDAIDALAPVTPFVESEIGPDTLPSAQ